MNDDQVPHGRHTELELAQGRRVVALRGKPKKGFRAPETRETHATAQDKQVGTLEMEENRMFRSSREGPTEEKAGGRTSIWLGTALIAAVGLLLGPLALASSASAATKPHATTPVWAPTLQ